VRVMVTCDFHLKYATAQSAGLARAGADVLLLCRTHAMEFGGDAAERRRALDAAHEAGVSTMEMPGRLWDLTAAPQLAATRKRIALFAPDIIHAHRDSDPRALLLLPEAPTVLTIHDAKPHPGHPVARFPPKRWFLNGADNAWVARARAIIVHSERLCEELKLRAHQRCFVVPHGLEVRNEPLPRPSEPTVGFFGRLEPYKGLDVLARAMPRVWARRPDVRLKVAGWGLSTLPLNDPRVQMERRYLPEAEIESFFAATSLAVLPYTEASQTGVGSRVVGYGVPVVASRVGGLPDLTLDQSYLVVPGDDAGLAAAILRHIDDDANIRARVLADVAAPRSWDAAAARSLELYEQLVGHR
jgi:glycosyltransferase involved in cell wall biosynthesis